MKYGLNQAGFPADDFEENCAIVSAAGYDGIEPNYVDDGPITTEDGRRAMHEAVERYDLDVPAVSTTLNWEYPLSSSDDEVRRRGVEIGREMIDAASVLGADEILLVPARIEAGADYEAAYERAVESTRELARYGSDVGVTVAVENVQNDFLYSPQEFRTFVERVESAGPVSVYFDVGNGLRWGLPDRWIRELDGYISRVHVKDWLADAHRVTYPLQGDVDWASVTEAIDAIDYDGWITAEVPPYPSHPRRMPRQVLENIRFLFEGARAN